MTLLILGLTILLGMYLAWTIGANDFANSMSDAVGSKALSIKGAVIFGGICELAGSVLVGTSVSDTVRKGIVDPQFFSATPEMLALGMICALLATAIFLHGATWFGMPVSTTHSIVGSIAGFGILAAGWSSVDWGTMVSIVSSWILSPIVGGILGFFIFKLIVGLILGRKRPLAAAVRYAPTLVFIVIFVVASATLYKGLKHVFQKHDYVLTDGKALLIAASIAAVCALISRFIVGYYARGKENLPLTDQLHHVEGIFTPLVIITSCSLAFAHGANDVANAIGPVAAALDIIKTGTVKMSVVVPFWILAMGGIGIVVGLGTSGYKVMRTIGTRITQLTPSRGTAADIAAVTTVLVCTRLKLPVSTTHTVVGAIIGVGFARGLGAVNRRVARDIFGGWIITVPAAGLLTAGLFFVAMRLHVDQMIGSIFP